VASGKNVTSIIRDPAQSEAISAAGAKPLVLSVEEASVADFTKAFEDTQADLVYWSAGAGGKGGPDRTRRVDYEGALKVFDAIEAVSGSKPRLVLVSAVDVRDPEKVPEYYVRFSLLFTEVFTHRNGRRKRTWRFHGDGGRIFLRICISSGSATRTWSGGQHSSGRYSVRLGFLMSLGQARATSALPILITKFL
jgi:hypothetical protein